VQESLLTQNMNKSFYILNNHLYAPNGHYCGDVDMTDDGYYQWFPGAGNTGYLSSEVLKAIAALLDEKNKEWDAIVQKELNEQS